MTPRVVLAYPGGLDTFDQPMATGFVELWGLPSTIAALREPAAAG
jgi:argininosuccinate synthase